VTIEQGRGRRTLRAFAVMAAAAIGWLSIAQTASAKTPAEVFEAFGLFGTWSPICAWPASPTNPRVTWQPWGEQVLHTVTFGGGSVAIRDFVGAAVAVDDHTLRITIIRSGTASLTVTLRVGDDYEQAVRSVGTDGHVFYDNGADVATGRAALIDVRCQASVS
jgi:hypothetical protein